MVGALDPILEHASKYGVRWAFVNLHAYKAVLARHGWVHRTTLENGVDVWENPLATLPARTAPDTKTNCIAALWWGIVPISQLFLIFSLAFVKRAGA